MKEPEKSIIPEETSVTLKSMAGFREIVIHNYTKLDMQITGKITTDHFQDIYFFAGLMLAVANEKG